MNVNNTKLLDKNIWNSTPTFYQEMIKTWINVNNCENKHHDQINNYLEIRKQVIWGNKFIKFQGKCLFFDNWIDSNILYINDIIDKRGNISEEMIISKLRNKRNWISEFSKLKKSIPKQWTDKLKSEESIKTKVHINRTKTKLRDCNDVLTINAKNIYNLVLSVSKTEIPVGFLKWERVLSKGRLINEFKDSIKFNFEYLKDNKIKMFRWKLMHFILPNEVLLFQWKISQNNLCSYCNEIDNYNHFFITCSYHKTFWKSMKVLLKKVFIGEHVISLHSLVIGYKIHDNVYYALNHLLSLMFFSVYKSHYVSNKKTKAVDTLKIFEYEVENTVELYSMTNTEISSLFTKVLNILKYKN